MSVSDWIDRLVPGGRYTFSKEDVRSAFPDMTSHAIDAAVHRAVAKKRIFTPFHGFYVAVPEEYRLWIAVPQEIYLDKMMQHMGKPYYVALLSAAERHGAAHQAPMGMQVMTQAPAPRDKVADGYAIRYCERRRIPMQYVQRREVPAGWLNISGPELTAVDLIAYQHQIGGITRAATVLEELALQLDFSKLDASFLETAAVPTFQRLGYLLDAVLEEEELAARLHTLLKDSGAKLKTVPLVPGISAEGAPTDKKWKIIINQEIEADDL